MSWELYGIEIFDAEVGVGRRIEDQPVGRMDLGENCTLAIGRYRVFIIERDTKVRVIGGSDVQLIYRQIPFDAIPSWDYSDETFTFYVGSFVRQEKLMFGTHEGKQIHELLREYVTYGVRRMENADS